MKKLKKIRIVILGLACIGLVACEKSPVTIVMHSPIYPESGEDIVYTLEKVTAGTINSAELFETISIINSSGVITTSDPETLIQSWTSPTGDLSYTKSGGYSANSLITYRYRLVVPEGTKSFEITYAIRPYPVADMPAPVYCQGDPDDVFDVIFIPDNDITNMNIFYTNCYGAIRDGYFDEPYVQIWRRQFNFYINPETGTATDYDNIATDGYHQTPANNANLSFAEAKALMHQNNLRDYAYGGLFSTEMQNRGTLLHESGHSLFGLADEYPGGAHWQANIFPNNWSSLADAQAAASDYGSCKSSADAVQIGTTGWYKLCVSSCQMSTSGLNHNEYDCPCKSRIFYVTLDNAIN